MSLLFTVHPERTVKGLNSYSPPDAKAGTIPMFDFEGAADHKSLRLMRGRGAFHKVWWYIVAEYVLSVKE